MSRLDLAGLVAAQVHTLTSIASPHAHLKRSLPDDLPPVMADAEQLTQVLQNLVTNAAEAVSRVYEPFFTTKFPGRGLGMPATLGIVRGHKGVIHVASKVGHGTTVSVLLPAAEPARVSAA